MKMNKQNNNHNQPHNSNLLEGLETGDLARLVDKRVTIDEYKSKLGRDEDIVVLAFKVQGKSPALDLVNFIEKSYTWILDADASSGELDDGDYLVFVEMDRDEEVPENLVEMFNDLEKLTEIPVQEWILSYHKPHKTGGVDAETIRSLVPLSIADYQARTRALQDDIDKLKTAAGVRVETRAPTNEFTESLRIAAGIR